MARMLADANLRKQLKAKGLKHAQQFSWEQTAAATLEVYRAVDTTIGRSR